MNGLSAPRESGRRCIHPILVMPIQQAPLIRKISNVSWVMLMRHGRRVANVISLNGEEYDESKRQIPMYIVVDPAPELMVMTEEIFGPCLCNCVIR